MALDPAALEATRLDAYKEFETAATPRGESSGSWVIVVRLFGRDVATFARLTKDNLNKQVAIVVLGQVLTAPIVRGAVTDGETIISGGFTEDSAATVVTALCYPSKPKLTSC
jgi:preprotein translocase subunit SecD